MLPFPGKTPSPILKHWISLTNRKPERAKDENRNHLYCMSISTRGGDSRRQGKGTKGKATMTSGGGGTPVRHKIPIGIVIFLVVLYSDDI